MSNSRVHIGQILGLLSSKLVSITRPFHSLFSHLPFRSITSPLRHPLSSAPPTSAAYIQTSTTPLLTSGPIQMESFPCSCGKGDVVRRIAASSRNKNRVYYACPDSKPKDKNYGCGFFMWEDAGTGSSSSSPGPSTPSSSDLGEANCSNCKLLSARIKVLELKLEMALHPGGPQSAAVLQLIEAVDKLSV